MKFFYGKNGGLVSIFLVIILVPILALGTSLTELSKKRSADSIISEAVDSASNSVLSNYDAKLMKRFGLIALAQNDKNTSSEFKRQFNKYMQANIGGEEDIIGNVDAMKRIVSLKDADVEFLYSLSDNEILKNQIMEACKLRVPITLMVDGYEAIVKKLEEKFKKVKNILNLMGDSAKEIQNIVEQVTDVISLYTVEYNNFIAAKLNYELNNYNTKTDNKLRDFGQAFKDYKKAVEEYNKAVEAKKEAERAYQDAVNNAPDSVSIPSTRGYSDESVKVLKILFNDLNAVNNNYRKLINYFANNELSSKDDEYSINRYNSAFTQWNSFQNAVSEELSEEGLDFYAYIKKDSNYDNWSKYWKNYKRNLNSYNNAQNEVNNKQKAVNNAGKKVSEKNGEMNRKKERANKLKQEVLETIRDWKEKSKNVETTYTALYEKISKIFDNGFDFTKGKNKIQSDVAKLILDSKEEKYSKNKDEEKENDIKDIKDLQKATEESDKKINDGFKKLFDEAKEVINNSLKIVIKKHTDKLAELETEVNNFNIDTSSSLGSIQKVWDSGGLFGNKLDTGGVFAMVISSIVAIGEAIVEQIFVGVKELIKKLFEDLKDMMKFISRAYGFNIMFDFDYNVNLDDGTKNEINRSYPSTSSKNDAKDQSAVQELNNATKDIQQITDFKFPEPGSANLDDSNKIEECLNNIKDGIVELIEAYTNSKEGFIGKVLDLVIPGKEVIDLFKRVITLIKSIIKIVTNLITLCSYFVGGETSIGEVGGVIGRMLYQKAIITTYATRMFSNRNTPFDSGATTMMGTSMDKIYHGSLPEEPETGKDVKEDDDAKKATERIRQFLKNEVESMAKEAVAKIYRVDSSFAMAEQEYIVGKSTSEYVNQSIVMGKIFLFRLLCNIPAAVSNEIADSLSIFAPIGWIIALIGETAGDMFFIASGVSVPLVKYAGNAYLSSANISNLVKKFSEAVKKSGDIGKCAVTITEACLNENDKQQQIKDYVKKAKDDKTARLAKDGGKETGGSTQEDKKVYKNDGSADANASESKKSIVDKLEISYDQMLFMMILFEREDEVLQRIKELIIMEMRKCYQNHADYSLNKAYTFMRVQTEGKWEPLLPVPGQHIIKQKRTFYRGY
ncbi:MAG: hypothetical protein K6F77_06825 [Lachnospiraceae bacterium]|nr:hypothetical protein [Lachnospiraceae bacterium]